MSNRKSWAFSTERPVAVQSPSMLSDVQTRLNFSSVKSPPSTLPKRRALNPMSRSSPTNTPPFRSTNNRLADYHMSKQNPDVLDRMYSSSVPSSPRTSPLRSQMRNSPLYHNHSGTSSTSSSPGVQFQNRMSHTPNQMSLLRQTLRANKAQSSSKSSLVQLATQRTSVKLSGPAASISPVVVRLSRGADTPPSPRLSRGSSTVGANEEQARNPCDKDTVLLALRSKRKRWESSPASVDSSVSVVTVIEPSAKRSKNGVQPRSPPSTGRKRPLEPPTLVQAPEVSKRSKIIKPVPKKANKICMPDIEYESDTSEHAQDDVSITNDIVASTSDSDSTVASVDKEEKTSPILPMDEEEMIKKREDSLSLLRTVFPPSKGNKSLRREVPVFCATGLKPHMPAPLSSGSTATREDLLKDREAAAERVKQFLTANDETTIASTDPKPNTLSLTTSGVETTEQTDGGKNPVAVAKSDVTTTINPVQTGLKLSSAVVGKMVSFANPITSGIPSTTTTISTSGVGTTSLTGLKLTSRVPSTTVPPPSTTAATLGPPTGPYSLSLLTPTAPLPSIATTQPPSQTQTAALKLGDDTAALKPSILTGGLTFGTPATTSSSALQTTANIASGLKLGPVTTQATQPQLFTGLKIGTLNAATPTGMGTLNTATPTGMGTLNTVTTGTKIGTFTGIGIGIGPSATPSRGILQSKVRAPSPLQVSHKPPAVTTNTTVQQPLSNGTMNNPLSLTQSNPTLSFVGQQPSGGGLSLSNTQGIGSLNSSGFSFGVSGATTQQPTGLMFGNTTVTSSATQPPSSSGLIFRNVTAQTVTNQQPGTGLMFGTNAATTQSTGAILFGSNTITTTAAQNPTGGLMFGNTVANATTQQSTGGMMFTSNTTTTAAAQNPTGRFMFGNTSTAVPSSTSSFTASQSTQNSIFGNQALKEAPKASGLLFSGSTSQNANDTFKFTANGSQQQPDFFSGGSNPQQSLTLNFGQSQSQPNTQSNSAMAGGGNNQVKSNTMFQSQPNIQSNSVMAGSGNNQVKSNTMFGGQNTSFTAQQPQQTSQSTGFNFSAVNNTQKAIGGPVNFALSPQTNVNFGMGQSQNGNGASGAFSFNAGSGMNSGQNSQSNSGFSFNAANNGQSNVFTSPQLSGLINPQTNFTTPQQSNPSSQGFNFSTAPNQFNFTVSTPPASSFMPPSTPADSTPRSTNRSKRRTRKK